MCTGGLEVPSHSRLTLSHGLMQVGHITCERVMSHMYCESGGTESRTTDFGSWLDGSKSYHV